MKTKEMVMIIKELSGALLQLLIFMIIPFIWWLISAREKENFFSWIGLKKIEHEGNWFISIGTSVLILLLYGLLTGILIKRFSSDITLAGSSFAGQGIKALPAVLIQGMIRTALSEELLFRGFILKRVKSKFGLICGITVQALIFGLLHGVPFGMATHNVWVTVALTVLPGALGWYQGWLNETNFKGSIFPSWIMHALVNVLVGCSSL